VAQEAAIVAGQEIAQTGYAHDVVLPFPEAAVQYDAAADRDVDLRERPGLGFAVAPAIAGEHADVRCDLLLDIQAEAVLLCAGAAGGRDVRGPVGEDGFPESAGPGSIQEAQHAQGAGVPPEFVPLLALYDHSAV